MTDSTAIAPASSSASCASPPARDGLRFLDEPHRIVEWMARTATFEPRPGGAFRLDYNGSDIASGEVLEIDRPRRLVLSWGWEAPGDATPPGASRVEVTLSPTATERSSASSLRTRVEAVDGSRRGLGSVPARSLAAVAEQGSRAPEPGRSRARRRIVGKEEAHPRDGGDLDRNAGGLGEGRDDLLGRPAPSSGSNRVRACRTTGPAAPSPSTSRPSRTTSAGRRASRSRPCGGSRGIERRGDELAGRLGDPCPVQVSAAELDPPVRRADLSRERRARRARRLPRRPSCGRRAAGSRSPGPAQIGRRSRSHSSTSSASPRAAAGRGAANAIRARPVAIARARRPAGRRRPAPPATHRGRPARPDCGHWVPRERDSPALAGLAGGTGAGSVGGAGAATTRRRAAPFVRVRLISTSASLPRDGQRVKAPTARPRFVLDPGHPRPERVFADAPATVMR